MMKDLEINFFVPGRPQGKARPRFVDGHAYTPRATVDYEGLIAAKYWESVVKSHQTLTEAAKSAYIEVEIIARYPVAVTDSKTLQLQKMSGRVRPKSKPDLDNVGKVVLDALNNSAYRDDAQVIKLTIEKEFAREPGLVVRVIHKKCVGDDDSGES